MDVAESSESRRWVRILFGGLLLVNLLPLLLILRIGGASFDQVGSGSGFLVVLVVCSLAPLAAWMGIVGARRGWRALPLALLGLISVGWPALVAATFVSVLDSLPKC